MLSSMKKMCIVQERRKYDLEVKEKGIKGKGKFIFLFYRKPKLKGKVRLTISTGLGSDQSSSSPAVKLKKITFLCCMFTHHTSSPIALKSANKLTFLQNKHHNYALCCAFNLTASLDFDFVCLGTVPLSSMFKVQIIGSYCL
jgi:hypothetical protein